MNIGSFMGGLVLSALVTPVFATRISTVVASTNMGSGYGTNIQNTVNGVGLSSLSISATHAGTLPPNSWVSGPGILTGVITFDLGGIYQVDDFAFWNQNGGGPGASGGTGIQGVTVQYSLGGSIFSALPGGPSSFARVTGFAALPPQVFNFETVTATHFRFLVSSNYGDTAETGFAEVGFNAIPEPATISVVVIGLCGFALRRSRLA